MSDLANIYAGYMRGLCVPIRESALVRDDVETLEQLDRVVKQADHLASHVAEMEEKQLMTADYASALEQLLEAHLPYPYARDVIERAREPRKITDALLKGGDRQ